MLQFLGWNPLEERRGHYSLVMMYKIVHSLVVIPTTPYTFSLLHTILVVIALNSWYHLLESMHSVTVTFLPQLGYVLEWLTSTHYPITIS